jgi:NitT/TauT family transport system permease protein
MFGIIVIALSLAQGLDRLPPVVVKFGEIERMSPLELTWRIRLPFVLPYMMHGLKLAVAYAFVGVIGGEFILAPAGLGHAIAYAYNDFDNPTMYGLMFFVIALVTTINLALHVVEKRMRRRRGLA